MNNQINVAIVTGGGGGIGKSIVQSFLLKGYRTAVFDNNQDKLNNLETEFNSDLLKCYCCDVTDEDSVNEMVQKVLHNWQYIDILVNNAGGSMAISQSIEEIELSEWNKVIDLNLKSTYLCCKAVIPAMKNQIYGRIINMSSMAGRSRSVFGGTPYAAAKAAIIGLTRQSSKDLGPYGITINVVAPGTVLSDERINSYWQNKTKEDKINFLESNPMRRLGKVEDISRTVLFLADEESSFITGSVIDVNGGMWVG